MAKIIVYVEHSGGAARRASLECLGAAHSTGSEVVAVLSGAGADAAAAGLGANGASAAVVLPGHANYSADATAASVAAVVQAQGGTAFLAAASSTGKDLAPRVAAHLDSVLFSDCTGISLEGDSFHAQRPWLAGKCIASLRSEAPVFCATTRVNVFPVASADGTAAVSTADNGAEPKATVASVEAKPAGALDVKEAPVVVAGGRGLKEAEGFGVLENLAAAFGNAAVGASRAVVDAGWRPHSEQIGQTGKTVSPQLYFAVGISGAIQHLAGMRTSKVIVAINKDADAPIFKVADYGIVGDAFEILPALTDAIAGVRAEG